MRSFKRALERSNAHPLIIIEDAKYLYESLSDMERSSFFSMLLDFSMKHATIIMSIEDSYYAHQINNCNVLSRHYALAYIFNHGNFATFSH